MMGMRRVVLLLLALGSLAAAAPLEAFVIAHSHCDAGWRVTVEEYYETQVRAILTNTVRAVAADPARRRFIWAETVFFSMWWQEQDEGVRDTVRELVAAERWELVEGGWVMSDEASASAYSRINMMTLGHEYLRSELGVRPRIGWQIDPFGGSSITPQLYRAMGYVALVNDRISLRTKNNRMTTKELQFIWRDSPSDAVDGALFTHTLDNWYWQPAPYNWDEGAPPVTDDNIEQLATDLVNIFKSRARYFRTPHVLYPFGHDFAFQDADIMFDNMDLLIDYINERPAYQTTVRYATLSEFFDTVMSANTTAWPEFTEDYLPFEDVPYGHFWTGHFTSRPNLKRATRNLERTLRVAETARALAIVHAEMPVDAASVEQSRRTSALLNHHDAITGTARQAVVEDYVLKATKAKEETEQSAAEALSFLLGGAVEALDSDRPTIDLAELPLSLLIYNSLGWPQSQIIALELDGADDARTLAVRDAAGNVLVSQANVFEDPIDGQRQVRLFFAAYDIPALGYLVVSLARDPTLNATTVLDHVMATGPIGMETATLAVQVDGRLGTLLSAQDTSVGLNLTIGQYFAEYNSTTESGAYLFWPAGPATRTPDAAAVYVTSARGPVVHEVRSARRASNDQLVEQEIMTSSSLASIALTVRVLGALGENKELVVRFATDLQTEGQYETDNGVFVKERQRDRSWDHLDPISSNYRPIISLAGIHDERGRLSVVTAQPHGVASLADGELEVMLQRRLMQDDGLGLGEGLDDHAPFEDRIVLVVNAEGEAATKQARREMILVNNAPALFLARSGSAKAFSGLAKPLPGEVHLTSFEARADGTTPYVALRLNHLFEQGLASAALGVTLRDHLADIVTARSDNLALSDPGDFVDVTAPVTLEPGAFASFRCQF